MEEPKSVRVIISGRVQGVWFRAWTQQEAAKRGLAGWVRNRRDGTVEAVFSGPSSQVLDMLKACHQGPPLAYVEHVTVEMDMLPDALGFHQRPTV